MKQESLAVRRRRLDVKNHSMRLLVERAQLKLQEVQCEFIKLDLENARTDLKEAIQKKL